MSTRTIEDVRSALFKALDGLADKTLATVSAETAKKPIAWRLVSEADGLVIQMCHAAGGWVDAYNPERAA